MVLTQPCQGHTTLPVHSDDKIGQRPKRGACELRHSQGQGIPLLSTSISLGLPCLRAVSGTDSSIVHSEQALGVGASECVSCSGKGGQTKPCIWEDVQAVLGLGLGHLPHRQPPCPGMRSKLFKTAMVQGIKQSGGILVAL